MVEAPTADVFRSALAPVQALRGEHSQLETWVRESFATLEALQNDLEEWQRELTRQQAELDQRAAGIADAERECVAELREMRKFLRQQHAMLLSLGATAPEEEDEAEEAPAKARPANAGRAARRP
jgi:peptidoglycan hydrolase CwlO-like protein